MAATLFVDTREGGDPNCTHSGRAGSVRAEGDTAERRSGMSSDSGTPLPMTERAVTHAKRFPSLAPAFSFPCLRCLSALTRGGRV